MAEPAQPADTARVFLVWDTDQTGVSLFGIFASRKGAEEARRTFRDASWVEEREVLGDLIDGEVIAKGRLVLDPEHGLSARFDGGDGA